MIQPTHADIGRRVAYRPHADGPTFRGVISSLSATAGFTFVRFRGPEGELTPVARLEWEEAPR